MKSIGITLLVSILTLGYASTNVNAQALGPANGYNAFIFGDDTETNTDSEGAIAVGGNANFTNYSIGSKLTSDYNGYGLVAGNNLSFGNGQVNAGNVAVGGTTNNYNFTVQHGTLTTGSHPVDFNAAQVLLTGSSLSYAGYAPTSVASIAGSGAVTLTTGDGNLQVFNLTDSQLAGANYQGLTINAKAGQTVLVNVSGKSVSMHDYQVYLNGTDANHVLFNYYQAANLSISGVSPIGSILAPFASVDFNNAHIDGTLIANSLNGTGELHDYQFTGSLTQVSAVPEPHPAIVLLLGCAMIGLVSIRRNKRTENK